MSEAEAIWPSYSQALGSTQRSGIRRPGSVGRAVVIVGSLKRLDNRDFDADAHVTDRIGWTGLSMLRPRVEAELVIALVS